MIRNNIIQIPVYHTITYILSAFSVQKHTILSAFSMQKHTILSAFSIKSAANLLEFFYLCKFILHYLGIWRIFTWELGKILFGQLVLG